ncbi:MAG: ABC transporter permease subunit [Bdellovibrionales bacterium]|nr:ABC transporter permease subunit [Ramlibacter sp.]
MLPARPAPRAGRAWSLHSSATRRVIYQVLVLAALAGLITWMVTNTLGNMRARGIQSGFGFLLQTAGFDISETMLPFASTDAYWRAFLIGILNTLRVAVLGIVLTTILGVALGVGRFSRNAIVRGFCYAYVEVFRTIPILIQLLLWYIFMVEVLPDPQEPWSVGRMIFLSKGGFAFPVAAASTGWYVAGAGMVLGLGAAWAVRRLELRRFARTGARLPSLFLLPLAAWLAVSVVAWLAGGAPTQLDIPRPGSFVIEGGWTLSPEFVTVLLGLTFYTAAFVAEVVRAGIASVSRGQVEAAESIGLARSLVMRLVVLPQALRVIIPPLTNQYLNLTKNSSLAVAIGYPDIVSIANTALNQTGRAVECIALIMAVYLCTSLATSALMNVYNRRAAIQER